MKEYTVVVAPIIAGNNVKTFTEKVTACLNDGWQLHGSLVAVPETESVNPFFAQALVREVPDGAPKE